MKLRLPIVLSLVTFTVLNIWTSVSADPSFESFMLVHTIDPAKHPESWTKPDWLNWMATTESQRYPVNPRGRKMRDRPLTTILLATESEILRAFQPGNKKLNRGNNQYMVWSNRKFETYVLDKDHEILRLFKTPGVYAAVDLDLQGRPKHLDTIFDTPAVWTNMKYAYSKSTRIF